MWRTGTKLALTLALSLVPVLLPSAAGAAPDHTVTLTPSSGPQTWTGAAPTAGLNQGYNRNTGEPCPDEPSADGSNYCEKTLLNVDVPAPVEQVEVSLEQDLANDFDLYIYASDASATRGALIDYSANAQTIGEVATVADASGYYLIQVVYFQTVASGYTATARIPGEGEPPPVEDIPQTDFYFHDDGPPPIDGTYDTTPPTSETATIAPGCQCIGLAPQPQWTGAIQAGRLNTLKVDFWQDAPVDQAALDEVNYDVTLFAGGKAFEFPTFTETVPPRSVPSHVVHVFTPEDANSPLPMALPGGEVTIEIAGHFTDAEAFFDIYYDSVNQPSGFSVNVPKPAIRAPFPPDVDVPPGLQELLASDPGLGFTSHSEPHVAQSPVDPDILVAGSKFYNRDPDALNEYEFKIGTYASFDGGSTWSDLGQLKVCPLADAPEDSWPNNTCYPEDDPAQDGPESGGPDIGEEYITSDVWVNFDDEGNAYVMVLDHPPYDGFGEGNGWGMTLHKWEGVSPQDVSTGDTWSERIPINFYDNPFTQSILLDDKNTFAVNNAGPDGDNQTGIMIACWGQTAADPVIGAGKQQIVCERSTDGGETWPGTPLPISDVEPLVIGVHVVADTQDPQTFYTTWLQYATGGAGADLGGTATPETLEFAVTTNGGVSWTRLPPVDTVTQIPRQFPGQRFRNLSIPIMSVGPEGELYIAIAQYLPAPDPSADEDGLQADITIYKSTDGGLSWAGPTNITADTGAGTNRNADQFQPYVAVTETGQVNVAYFDRRLDVRTEDHGGNYFTDAYLSRSNDGGASWTDVRLTHDATDPEFNAPVSPSGLFFGDYQGLVADDCFAVPFFNDTHLANDEFLDPGPIRDPDFDDGYPSSPYQEAVAWRVPNIEAYGGSAAGAEGCPADLAVTKTDAPDPAHVGQNLTYTITVSNNGPGKATGVTAVDQLPKNAGFGSATTTKGTCAKPTKNRVTCTIGDLAAGQSATITIVVKPTKKGTITNTVTVSSPSDPDSPKTATAQTTVLP